MERTLTPLNSFSDMKDAIESAGAWFIGSFMLEFVDNYEKFQDKKTKTEYIEYFLKEYDVVTTDIKYSLQGTTQGRYLTGGVPPVRFSM